MTRPGVIAALRAMLAGEEGVTGAAALILAIVLIVWMGDPLLIAWLSS